MKYAFGKGYAYICIKKFRTYMVQFLEIYLKSYQHKNDLQGVPLKCKILFCG